MNPVDEYMGAKKEMFRYFNCKDEYHCQHLPTYTWQIKEDNDVFFLSYWRNARDISSSVVVKKEGKPLIFKTSNYTMVIAIDCIKMAFVFKNNNEYMM